MIPLPASQAEASARTVMMSWTSSGVAFRIRGLIWIRGLICWSQDI
jgi:hypothetical protein